MSLLGRYRKPGGFLQLIQLVETTEPQRRKNLIELIAKEDPGWANLVCNKMLTPEKVLAWSENTLNKVWPHMPLNIIMIIWQKSASVSRARIEHSLPQNYYLPFRRAAEAIKPLEESAVITARLRLVAIVRELDIKGKIKLSEIDPALALESQLIEFLDPFNKAS